MKLYLYSVNDGDNVINKSLGNPIEIDIVLKSDTDIINPVILLETISGVDFSEFNYCHIPELNRYYFITTIQNVNNRLWNLHCECDVLMTYKQDIINSNARLWRGIKTGDYANIVVDTSVIKSVSKHESDVSIDESERTIILTVVGE